MKHTNIYIVDDSLTIRAMMQSLVEQDRAFTVCGLAGNIDDALDDIEEKRPDVVLLDLALPTEGGLSFLDRAQAQIHDPWQPMKVIIVSASAKRNASVCAEAFERGALACFDKSRICSRSDELLSLLHEVDRGEIDRYNYLSDAVTLPEPAHDLPDMHGFMLPPAAVRLPSVLTFI